MPISIKTELPDAGITPTIERILQIETTELKTNRSGWAGWYKWPLTYTQTEEYRQIQLIAEEIRQRQSYLVVIGIGGSYLGAKAIIEALQPSFDPAKVIFAGFSLDGHYLQELCAFLEDRDFYINIVSKSGGTIEPAIAFRVLKQLLERKYNRSETARRIIATTDAHKGILKGLADQQGYRTLVVPDDIGGRFSVLTAVGLLPIAVAGFSIDALLQGARECQHSTQEAENPLYSYVCARDHYYKNGKEIEIMSTFEPRLRYFNEWWKQLFGESEGKSAQGLFPAATIFSTDLHSLGQWIQEGPRILFETFLFVHQKKPLVLPDSPQDFDQLNYLVGKDLNQINYLAYQGTAQAHESGDVPIIRLELDRLDEFTLGEMVFFFQKTTALNGYLMGINPFDQPGVEAYKKNMFRLLGRP